MKIAPDKNKWNRIIMDADTVIVEFWKNVKSRIFCYVFMFVLDEHGVPSVKSYYTSYILTKWL